MSRLTDVIAAERRALATRENLAVDRLHRYHGDTFTDPATIP